MIIEIRGLAPGQTVKHISVDIEFENGVPSIRTKADAHCEHDDVLTPGASGTSGAPNESNVSNAGDRQTASDSPSDPFIPPLPSTAPSSFENRPKKDIPVEMMDLEF